MGDITQTGSISSNSIPSHVNLARKSLSPNLFMSLANSSGSFNALSSSSFHGGDP